MDTPRTFVVQTVRVGDEVQIQFKTDVLPFTQTYRVFQLISVEETKVVVKARHEHLSGSPHSFPFYFATSDEAMEFADRIKNLMR